MLKVNDYIIYKKEVCQIKDILKDYYHEKDYYQLTPLSDNTLNIKVPVDNKELRNLITKDQVMQIIAKIDQITPIEEETKNLENIYKELLKSGEYSDLIKIIKTTYLRNKERLDNHKKTTDKDTYYFELAEKYLTEEFQIVLGLTYEQTRNFIIDKVEELSSK